MTKKITGGRHISKKGRPMSISISNTNPVKDTQILIDQLDEAFNRMFMRDSATFTLRRFLMEAALEFEQTNDQYEFADSLLHGRIHWKYEADSQVYLQYVSMIFGIGCLATCEQCREFSQGCLKDYTAKQSCGCTVTYKFVCPTCRDWAEDRRLCLWCESDE